MPKIVHFEIPADDMERARNFYQDLFGWKITPYQEGSDYWMISTDEDGEKGLDGGMMARQHPNQPIVNYIEIPSVDDYMKKVTDLSGKVLVPKMPVPGMGYFAVCMDTEGNSFGIWETDPNAAFLADPAEAFIALMAAVIASDEKYSVDEIRTVWHQVEGLEIFRDKDYKDLESKIFKRFDRDPASPAPFDDRQIEAILASARQLLGPELRESAFAMAARLAHADKTLQGYVETIDPREQRLLDRIREGLEIRLPAAERVLKEIAEARFS